jgi:hypothetical protein
MGALARVPRYSVLILCARSGWYGHIEVSQGQLGCSGQGWVVAYVTIRQGVPQCSAHWLLFAYLQLVFESPVKSSVAAFLSRLFLVLLIQSAGFIHILRS